MVGSASPPITVQIVQAARAFFVLNDTPRRQALHDLYHGSSGGSNNSDVIKKSLPVETIQHSLVKNKTSIVKPLRMLYLWKCFYCLIYTCVWLCSYQNLVYLNSINLWTLKELFVIICKNFWKVSAVHDVWCFDKNVQLCHLISKHACLNSTPTYAECT